MSTLAKDVQEKKGTKPLRPPTCVLRPINSDNARPFCITAAAGTELARATLVVYVMILLDICLFIKKRDQALPNYDKEFTTRRAFILYVTRLDQTFVHCLRFLTAATLMCLDRSQFQCD